MLNMFNLNDDSGFVENFINMVKMKFLMNFRTGDAVFDMLFSSFVVMCIPIAMSYAQRIPNLWRNAVWDDVWHIFSRQHVLELEGKRILKCGYYTTTNENLFSMRFRALWHFVSQINKRGNIYSMREMSDSGNEERDDDGYAREEKQQGGSEEVLTNDIFVVEQRRPFVVAPDIYCKVRIYKHRPEHTQSGGRSANTPEVNDVIIKLFSYKKDVSELQEFLDGITHEYLNKVHNKRYGKQYIYSLQNFSKESDYAKWDEYPFQSSRSFDNGLFFEQKELLLRKLDFFEKNQAWYTKHGIPYTLGLGLKGPPGTGKTSVIKCIANYLKRHVVVIPLNKIKSEQQFYKCFFESTYNKSNYKNSVDFSKKIIVLEDIDCMSDVVKRRDIRNVEAEMRQAAGRDSDEEHGKNELSTSEMLTAVVKGIKDRDDSGMMTILNKCDESSSPITLSFLLNVFDGIRETPGRIMIMTSNNYESLDEALVRPGRIDLCLDMKKASVSIINEMYSYYYGGPLPLEYQKRLRDYVVSQALITNIYFCSSNKDEFLANLLKHFE